MKKITALLLTLALALSFCAPALALGKTFTHPEIGEPMTVGFPDGMPMFKIYGFIYYELPSPLTPFRGMTVNQYALLHDRMPTLDESLSLLLDSVEGKGAEEAAAAFDFTGVMEEYAEQLKALPKEQKIAAIKLLGGFEGTEGYKALEDIPGFENADTSNLIADYQDFTARVNGARYPYRVLQFLVEGGEFYEYFYERYAYLKLEGTWRLVRVSREYADMYAEPPAYVHGIAGYVSVTLDDVHYEIMQDLAWGATKGEVLELEGAEDDGDKIRIMQTELYGVPADVTFSFTDGGLSEISYRLDNEVSYYSAFISLYSRYLDPITVMENGDMSWPLNDAVITLVYDKNSPVLTVSFDPSA
jgi:hypothetical protein